MTSWPAAAAGSYLTTAESAEIDGLVARIEAQSGVQVVTAVVGRSDAYIELPWKAFALGASIGGFGLVVADTLRPHWTVASTALLHVTVVLGVAAACALAAILAPSFARLFLRAARGDEEVRQYAQALFLEHGLFATRARTAVLILVSLFERRIEIVADTGFDGRITAVEWQAIVQRLAPHLRTGRPFHAVRDGLAALADLLAAKGFRAVASVADELPNRTIEERGK